MESVFFKLSPSNELSFSPPCLENCGAFEVHNHVAVGSSNAASMTSFFVYSQSTMCTSPGSSFESVDYSIAFVNFWKDPSGIFRSSNQLLVMVVGAPSQQQQCSQRLVYYLYIAVSRSHNFKKHTYTLLEKYSFVMFWSQITTCACC